MLEWPRRRDTSRKSGQLRAIRPFFTRAPLTVVVLTKPYASSSDDLLRSAGLSFEERYRRGPLRVSRASGQQSNICFWQPMNWDMHRLDDGTMVAAPELERVLGVTEPWQMAALIPLGVPAEKAKHSTREPLEDVMTIID